MEAVNWVCDDALDEQEAKVLEALQYDLANPCAVGNGLVLGTNKSQQWIFERRSDHREIQRGGEYGHVGHFRSSILEDGYSKTLLS